MLPPEPHITGGGYKKRYIVWIKTPHGRCATKFRTVHVTEVISQQSVPANGTPHHVKDLCPFQGSHPSNEEGDTEDSEPPNNLGLDSPKDPSDISVLLTNHDMPCESSSEVEEIQTIPLWRSTQNKRLDPPCHLCDQVISGRSVADTTSQNLNLVTEILDFYCYHKRACLCLVCRTLMLEETSTCWN